MDTLRNSLLPRSPDLAHIDRTIALAFGALVFVLMAVVLVAGGYYYHWLLEREENQLTGIVSHVLADSINRTGFSGKYHTRLLVEEITAKEPRIAYAMVVNADGTVVAHSDPALNNTIMNGPAMAVARRVLSGERQVIQDLQYRGESVKEVALPFRSGYLEELTGVVRVGISTQGTRVALFQGLVLLIGGIVALLLVATVFIYRLSRSFGQPVKQLAAQMQGILDHAPLLIAIRDRYGYLHETSASFRRVFGIDHPASANCHWQALAPSVIGVNGTDDSAVFDRGEVTHNEVRRLHGDEQRVYMLTKFPIARDARGRVTLLCAIAHDVSERVRAEAALRESEQRLAVRQAAEAAWQQAQTELERRVEERTAALKASNEELEAFSYSVSHDLRGPLRAINGFSGALQEECTDALNEVALGYIARIQNATLRMSDLIDGLLGLSRVFRSELQTCEVDLAALGHEIARQLREAEPERKAEIEIEAGLIAEGDPTLIRLLLQNLLGNAWKFTRTSREPRILLGRADLPGEVFVVRDNGFGFEMEYAHKLFQPFERLHTEEAFQGTGIGLATVRRIVQRHGGAVWAEGAPGLGAAFFFTLAPADTPHLQRAAG